MERKLLRWAMFFECAQAFLPIYATSPLAIVSHADRYKIPEVEILNASRYEFLATDVEGIDHGVASTEWEKTCRSHRSG